MSDSTEATDTDPTAQIDLLEGILSKTGDLVAGVGADQWSQPTPCPDYDVQALVDHIIGWMQTFAAGAAGTTPPENPAEHHAGDDPAAEVRAAAAQLVQGWRDHGFDREVRTSFGASPASMVFNMTLMEYLAHGCDLAKATDQAIPYTAAEGEQVLARAMVTLPPEYQGEGQAFGAIVPVPDDAPAVDRFLGFLGRQP